MLFTRDSNTSEYIIQSYTPGKIKINNIIYTQSLIVSAKQLLANWTPQSFSELKQEHFMEVVKLQPEVVLLGTGQKQQFPNTELLLPFIKQNISVEVMDTGAACRTFTALTAEKRQVVAALIIE